MLNRASFIKKVGGINSKKETTCGSLISLVLLFMLATFSGHMVVLLAIFHTLKAVKAEHPDQSPEQNAVDTYLSWFAVDAVTLVMTTFLSVFSGYLYEIWKRKTVLIFCMVCLVIGMIIPQLSEPDADKGYLNWYALSRMGAAAMAEIILANPLLNDYVKKSSHGWANSFQELGKEIGHILAFIAVIEGMTKNPEYEDVVYYTMTGVVLIIGLLTIIFLVKEPKISRVYANDDKGNPIRQKPEKEAIDIIASEDEAPPRQKLVVSKNDTYHFGGFVGGFALSVW